VVDDDVVLLGEVDGRYHGLDPVGARIWQLLDGQRTVGRICEQLACEFEVTPLACLGEVEAFLIDLASHGLIEIT